MKVRQINLVIVIFVAILLMACDIPEWVIVDNPKVSPSDVPPFVITKPVVEITERLNYFKCAGIVFKFLNNAEKPVDKITISFMIFDTKTQLSPFTGSNVFEIEKQGFVASGENKEICISLDHFIYIAPTEPYLIDFFYISQVLYTDGSVWQDKNGKFRVRDL